jgi:hypothetical protein
MNIGVSTIPAWGVAFLIVLIIVLLIDQSRSSRRSNAGRWRQLLRRNTRKKRKEVRK